MNNDSTLPKYGYLAFDALSMKAFLKQRLSDNGVFTDQLYEGSNLSQIIDVFALTFQNLIFYMNKTGAEGLFSDAQIYENINRITKSLGYNPVGVQTALLPFKMKAPELQEGKTYIIPRYSSVQINGYTFSSHEDIIFTPSVTDSEGYIDGISNAKILYNGTYIEFPEYEAVGDDYELMELNPGESVLIDHFNIDVYVYSTETGKWTQAKRTQSLYLNNASDFAYECRLNENNYYEIKFGNDICGRKLKVGDKVQIYYLKSQGDGVSVGAKELDGFTFVPFQSEKFKRIMADINKEEAKYLTEINNANTGFITLYNSTASTYFTDAEDVESIRENAPDSFRAQYRLVTAGDFKSFISTNYSNVIRSVYIMNNWEYLQTYMKYFHAIGLSKPSSDTRMALSQFMFSDACNFNNVYIFAVPKIIPAARGYEYVPNELKAMMLQDMNMYKTLTCEPVVIDPVYMAFKFGVPRNGTKPSIKDGDVTKLVIEKTPSSHRSSASIKEEIISIVSDFFNPKNNELGKTVGIATLAQKIAGIDGIQSFKTVRTENGEEVSVSGLSFVIFNETYPEICDTATSDYLMEGFQYPYYHKLTELEAHIEVTGDDQIYNTVEY